MTETMHVGADMPPGAGPIDGVMHWRNELYVARDGCIWQRDGDGWVLADGENMPPSFPGRRSHADE